MGTHEEQREDEVPEVGNLEKEARVTPTALCSVFSSQSHWTVKIYIVLWPTRQRFIRQ